MKLQSTIFEKCGIREGEREESRTAYLKAAQRANRLGVRCRTRAYVRVSSRDVHDLDMSEDER